MTATRNVSPRSIGTTLYVSGAALALLGMAHQFRPAPRAPATFRIVARDYSYDVPASIAAGTIRVELVNAGKELHHAQLIRLEQGKTLKDLAALSPEAPPPSWAVLLGGPNAVEPGDSVGAYQRLAPGSYAIVCFIPGADGVPHMMKGMAAGFTVGRPSAPAAGMPKADASIRLADYGFQPSAPIRAGHRSLNVVNDASQPHELVLFRLDARKTAGDLATWSASHMQGPPPGHFVGGVVGLAPGASTVFEATLEPGNYALICYLPDIKDGMPHFAHGMIAPLTVTLST